MDIKVRIVLMSDEVPMLFHIISLGVSAVSGIREEVKQIAGETTVKDG